MVSQLVRHVRSRWTCQERKSLFEWLSNSFFSHNFQIRIFESHCNIQLWVVDKINTVSLCMFAQLVESTVFMYWYNRMSSKEPGKAGCTPDSEGDDWRAFNGRFSVMKFIYGLTVFSHLMFFLSESYPYSWVVRGCWRTWCKSNELVNYLM